MVVNIKTDSLESVLQIVNEASKIDGDVLCSRGRICVDAKSLMGLVSLNLSKGASIEYPDGYNNFTEFLISNANGEVDIIE